MASTSQSPSSGVRRLDSLPPELLDHIFSFLVPPMPEIGETRPIGSYEKLLPVEPWYEPTRCRAALRASCLVSRQIRDIAEQYQYRNVALLSGRQFVSFLRTLATRHEDIAKWNRYFSVPLTLNDTEVYTYITELFRKLPTSTWTTSTHDTLKTLVMFRPGKRDKRKGESETIRHIPECLLAAMLTVLHKTETFLLQLPVCETEDQPQYTTLLETIHYSKQTIGQSIKTLLLQTDPEILSIIQDDIEAHGDPGVTACNAGAYWPMLLHCPNITTIDVAHDDGNWCTSGQPPSDFCLVNGGCPSTLPRMKHVWLNDSYSNPSTLADLLAHMPELETLYVDPKWSEDNEAWTDTPVIKTLDESLLAHGKNLRRLDLGFRECDGVTESIGEDGVLTCLPQLTKIEVLHLQLGLLFSEAPEYTPIFSSTTPDPCPSLDRPSGISVPFRSLSQRLPPNVVHLTLEDWWWRPALPFTDKRFPPSAKWNGEPHEVRMSRYYHNQRNVQHRRAIVDGLLRFAEEVRSGAMPKLRKVLFLARTGERWTFQGLHFREKRTPSALTLAHHEKRFLEHVNAQVPPGSFEYDGSKWRMLQFMLSSVDVAIDKKTGEESGFAGLKQLIAEVESLVPGGDNRDACAKWHRLTQTIEMRDMAQSSETGQPIMEPLTLGEHMAEVEGAFARQGIAFEVSDM